MKCIIPEISWHNREPVLSLDIHPINNEFYRLVTGGSDTLILIWKVKSGENPTFNIEILSQLNRHQKAVNVVKWSPDGQYLASGDDDGHIILWQLKTDNIPSLEDNDNDNKEKWVVQKILRGHKEDVYDICWSPSGSKLLSGSVDNTAILWDTGKGKLEHILADHKSFVQGVTWDPKNQYVATLSSDRICRVFDENGHKIKARIGKGFLPVDESHDFYQKEVKYFHDDTFKTFFRRLCFSPDGSFLIVPSGSVETEESKNAMNGTFIFTLDCLKQPAALLPTNQCTIVAKCCPMLFELRPNGPKPVIDLPYRMIIAVATDSDVILYDTQQMAPFAHLQKIHYTRLTDLTWSYDGLLLAASSTDGFITLVTFEYEELGIQYTKEESETEDNTLNISGCEELEAAEETNSEPKIKPTEIKPKKPSFLLEWAKKGPKRKADAEIPKETSPKKLKSDTNEVIDIADSPDKKAQDETINKIAVRKRITPITIESKTLSNPTSEQQNNSSAPITLINDANLVCEQENKTEIKKIVPRRIKPTTIETRSPNKNTQIKNENLNECNINTNVQDVNKIGDDKKEVNTKICDTSTKQQTAKSDLANQDEKKLNSENVCKTESNNKVDETSNVKTDIEKSNNAASNNKEVKSIIDSEKNEVDTPSKTVTTPKVINSTKRNVTPKDVNKSNKKTPKSAEHKTTSAKKKTPCTSKMSLLQFFKPISNKSKIESNINSKDVKKTSPAKEQTKSNKIVEELKQNAVIDLSEDTGEIPEDFCLRVEESSDESENTEMVTEKENSENEKGVDEVEVTQDRVEMLKSEVKQARRIPLITLSSPKNKKKKI